MRQIQISVPNSKATKVIDILKKKAQTKNIMRLDGETDTLFIVRTQDLYVVEYVKKLQNAGVGVDYGIIDVVALEATIPYLQESEDKKKKPQESRLLTEEIYQDIMGGAVISRQYILYIVFAALIAGFGLYTNSPTVVVASMLISPLMGPILGFTLAINLREYKTAGNALASEFLGLGIALLIGILLGIIFPPLQPLPSEMSVRGTWGAVEVLIAFISGVAVTFSITSGIQSALVGVAISASLMPPAVNTGMALMLGELEVAMGSLGLFGMNVLAINLSAFIVMFIKKIHPLRKPSQYWVGPEPDRVEEREKSWWEKIFIQIYQPKKD